MQAAFRFLIIEESMASRIVIRDQFTRLNQHIDLVSTIEEALERIASAFYDMILVDSRFYHELITMDFKSLIPEQNKMTLRSLIGIMTNQAIDLSHQQSLEDYLYFAKPFSSEKTIQIIDYLKVIMEAKHE
ncbi:MULTISPECIES: hypothetical protein [Legionellaceae]|jgi:CheY-like chemotaxis protein|uniref:Response regulatory domain-containing protein n=1 Tax=Fluoribacter dumoffii TaxID=463 RepID=A0A377ITN2_9GAMM|nr:MULTISPECIES: hypothetical protein [Legionellaceae]MBN9231302.1 hypothetical protein [Legionella sp.]MCA0402516.1 hypothetical protein [Pseudomonadota bacterium]OJX98158.1 MAG: hypothetical protein BGO90_15555 [Legionella sp. 40-6]MBN9227984.1 hypothetical protein [Legionella steelei]OJW12715.1 MAG: hypothetical protein BGO44_18470 [Legionella sp. 39-23]